MSAADDLTRILRSEVEGCRALMDILRQERQCLIRIDAAALEDLAKEKDGATLRLRLLEEERQRVSAALAAELGAPPDAGLRKLAELSGDRLLRDIRQQLVSFLQGISEMNEFNRILLDRSSGVVAEALNFLEASGAAGKRPAVGSSIISREA